MLASRMSAHLPEAQDTHQTLALNNLRQPIPHGQIFPFFFRVNYNSCQTNSSNAVSFCPHTGRLHFHFSLSCIGEGNGNPLQCSCLESPRDGGAWWAALWVPSATPQAGCSVDFMEWSGGTELSRHQLVTKVHTFCF